MKINILTFKSRIETIQFFLNHYFQNLDDWKHNFSTELHFSSEDWSIDIYDEESIYESWTFDDIKDYLDRNNVKREKLYA